MKNEIKGMKRIVLLAILSFFATYNMVAKNVCVGDFIFRVISDSILSNEYGFNHISQSYVELSGYATVNVSSETLVVKLEGKMHDMKQYLVYSFFKGSGESEEVVETGTVFPIKVKQKTVWNTDEAAKTANVKNYEGVIFSKLISSYTLKAVSENSLVFSIDNEGVLCKLTRE